MSFQLFQKPNSYKIKALNLGATKNLKTTSEKCLYKYAAFDSTLITLGPVAPPQTKIQKIAKNTYFQHLRKPKH